MKTQFTTITGYGIVLLLSSFTIYPIYAVSNDKNVFLNVSNSLQDTKQKPTIKLSGTVKDSFGALGGVIVTVGTTVVTSDLNGKYTIDITSGDKITFSMIGYKDQSIVFVGGNVLNITLNEDNNTLDEIVVNAGYYTIKDRERTGSIARITAKDIEFQPVTNPLQALQGRMAGVSITQNSGVPGGGFDIQIRGKNSLRHDGNNPLFIIDGIPFLSNSQTSNSMSSSILPKANISPLNLMNPNDIESITVLKDADATAIYGSRGANGIVLITTKKGRNGKTSFTINSQTSMSKVANFAKLMNTEQFNKMREIAIENDKLTPNIPKTEYDINGAWDKYRYTDWQKELIGGTAIDKTIQLGISGGNEQTKFLINGNHYEASSVFPGDMGYKRNTILLNLNHKSNDNKLEINTSTNYTVSDNNLIETDFTKKALTLAPNAPALRNEDGSLNWQHNTFNNPLAELEAKYKNNSKSLFLNTNIGYRVFDELLLKINLGISNSSFSESIIKPHTTTNPSRGLTSADSYSMINTVNNSSYIIEPQISWSKNFSNHSFDILIGTTFQNKVTNINSITGFGYTSNALIYNISSANNIYTDNTSELEYRYNALFGRINYMYLNKYIMNLTGRRDGSSRFGKNNQFGNFGAIGVAWLFSNENLLLDKKWLSFGKIRASYGTTGNDQIGDYQYLDTYTASGQKYDNIVGIYPSRLHNPNFSWETTTKQEIALELGFLKERINTTITYYNNRSSNQLVGIPLPGTTGFSSIQANLPATIKNTGWEFTLNTTNIINKNWKWTTDFNISIPNNKLVAFPGLEGSTYANQYVIGKSVNIKKVYHYEGINPTTGLYMFTDYNNDGKITSEDKQQVKEIGVKFHGGLQNNISYKNLNLGIFFQFVKQQNYNYDSQLLMPGALVNQPIEMLNSWSSNNPNSNYSFYGTGKNTQAYTLTKLIPDSDRAISDASYIRLKNISLSYRLDISKSKIEDILLYFQGQNLFTLSNFYGMDPELVIPGYLPPLKTYSLGIQLTF